MTCPDWRPLVAHRRRPRAEPPPGWPAALEHLDVCEPCRRAAFALDPTLVFARLPSAAVESDEARRVASAVETMIRARAAERALAPAATRRAATAAAALALAAALVLSSHVARGPEAEPAAAGPFAAGAAPPVEGTRPDDGPPALVDALGHPQARIYQLAEEDLSVVMIVDESLDV